MGNNNLPLLIGGVGLVRGSIKGFGPALAELSYEISERLVAQHWIDSAPFSVVSLIVRYGDSAEPDAEIGRVNSHGELEVAVQTSADELRDSKGDLAALKEVLRPYVLMALSTVAYKYDLVDVDAAL